MRNYEAEQRGERAPERTDAASAEEKAGGDHDQIAMSMDQDAQHGSRYRGSVANGNENDVKISLPFKGIYVRQEAKARLNGENDADKHKKEGEHDRNAPSGMLNELTGMVADEDEKPRDQIKKEHDIDNMEQRRGDNRDPFFQVLMSANRDRVVVQGLLNNASISLDAASPDFKNVEGGDTLVLFNENHVLKRLGLTRIESEEELRALIKPSHRELLYESLNVIKENGGSKSDMS